MPAFCVSCAGDVNEARSRTVEEERGKPPKVLVIDDDTIMVRLIIKILRDKELDVVSALSGEKGLRLAESEMPDVILLDVSMPPGISGPEVCSRLRLNPKTEKIPVIFLTARVDMDAMELRVEEEAQDYVLKPFLPSVLLTKIDEVLGKEF
jgi:CheY-like chemotaxis protein